MKKVDDRKLFELSYRMRRGGKDFRISLYFDPQNFRHLMTTYRLQYSPYMADSPDATARQNPARIKLEEHLVVSNGLMV